MSNYLSKTLDGSYLKTYLVFAGCLSALSILGMVLFGIFAYEKSKWSYGIIVLLFLSLIMAILAIISMVAFYREKGRYHERITPLDKAELLDEIEKVEAENATIKDENATIKAENATIKAEITTIKDENATIKAEKEEVKAENEKLTNQLNTRNDHEALLTALGWKDWEDGYKETKIELVKAYCEKIDEALEAAKTKSEKDLEGVLKKIKTDFDQMINPQP